MLRTDAGGRTTLICRIRGKRAEKATRVKFKQLFPKERADVFTKRATAVSRDSSTTSTYPSSNYIFSQHCVMRGEGEDHRTCSRSGNLLGACKTQGSFAENRVCLVTECTIARRARFLYYIHPVLLRW